MTVEHSDFLFKIFLAGTALIAYFVTLIGVSPVTALKPWFSKAGRIAIILLATGSFLNWDTVAKSFQGESYVIVRIIAGALIALALGTVMGLLTSQFISLFRLSSSRESRGD